MSFYPLLRLDDIYALPNERRITTREDHIEPATSKANPGYPFRNYSCNYGQPGSFRAPFTGYQPSGSQPSDWGDRLTYVEDAKIGYFGKRQYLTCPDGKSRLKAHNFIHVSNEFHSFGHGRYLSPFDLEEGSCASSVLPYLFSLKAKSSLEPNTMVFDLGKALSTRVSSYNTSRILTERILDLETDAFYSAMDKTQIADVGSTLVEIKELGSLFSHSYDVLKTLANVANNANLGTVRGVVSILDAAASFWLNYSYGLKPVFGLAQDLANRMNRRVEEKLGLSTGTIRSHQDCKLWTTLATFNSEVRHGQYSWSGDGEDSTRPSCSTSCTWISGGLASSISGPDGERLYSFSSGNLSGPLESTLSGKLSARVYGSWTLGFGPYFILDQLNLNPNLGHVWEALRFSFLIDWFYKVGDFLSRLDTMDNFVIYGANLSFELQQEVSTSTGASATSRIFMRSADFNPSGTMNIGSSNFLEHGQLFYMPRDIKPGTLVSKLDARAANAMSLLVVLSTAIARGRHIARSTADKQLSARISRLLAIVN